MPTPRPTSELEYESVQYMIHQNLHRQKCYRVSTCPLGYNTPIVDVNCARSRTSNDLQTVSVLSYRKAQLKCACLIQTVWGEDPSSLT